MTDLSQSTIDSWITVGKFAEMRRARISVAPKNESAQSVEKNRIAICRQPCVGHRCADALAFSPFTKPIIESHTGGD
jgi:hypothetical protein